MSGTSYVIEFVMGDEERAAMHPTANEVMREIEGARRAGWWLVTILRDYVQIDEMTLHRDAEKEASARGT